MSDSAKRVFKCIGATVAYLIGSGFASGQEILQFFTAYGPLKSGLGGVLTLVVLCSASAWVLEDARRLQLKDVNAIFRYYCGPWLGTLFQWLTPLFLFGIYVIMLAGAGSLLHEYFGLPTIAGRAAMLALSLATVLLGLARLTDIIGGIGQILIVLVLLVGTACALKNAPQIAAAADFLAGTPLDGAAPYWWLSGIDYAAFSLFTLLPFLAGVGRELQNARESRLAGLLGCGAFTAAALTLNYGMLANIAVLYDKAVPTVYMADLLLPGLGVIFSGIMLAGIYTTAVPMLWTACNKLAGNDHSVSFRLVACSLAAIAFFGGGLPFGTLIHRIYPYIGYFGILVYGCMVFRRLRESREKQKKILLEP